MIIKNMFSKSIDRDIKGVIKVGQDDDANIKQELEEYVVTRELQKHFSDFFASYKRGITGNTDKMGVWISGFFGSGKSHFLKILSYLLENKEVCGKKAIDYFVDDNKISDQMVLADMKLAGTIPTDVVLFNIDSKSEVNGKQSKVAIVSVLQNVFNEMQGFSGSNPFLADLERKLTEEGKYDLFKEKFEDSFGSTWEESRSDFDFIQDDVVEVLDEIEFMSIEAGRNWCEKATGEYTYKVEDFASLEENLDFIANAIGNKGKTSREVIRNYFLTDFIKDHIKIYQKRPIYWLFDSGKQNGFKALVYMHRWNADTIGNVRVEYLHRIQRVYEKEITRMQEIIDNSNDNKEISNATKRKEKLQKQIKETKDYDAKIAHLALSRIDIDLDDGVKVNYEKVQTADGKKMQILAKI